jgi:hypothetical protein
MQTELISKCTASASIMIPSWWLVARRQRSTALQLDRLRWLGCGLALRKNDKLQAIAGRYADLDTLAALHELGMPLDCIMIRAVAVSGRLNILQHLITEWNCEICTSLSYYAARSGSSIELVVAAA